MIPATVATWLNYATTLAFQILFAARLGSSLEAGAFVIAFAVAVSVAGVFITSATTLVMPRLVMPEGALSTRAVRALGLAVVGVAGTALLIAGAPFVAADAASDVLRLPASTTRTVLILSAAIVGLFGLSGVIGTVALARGRRFIPAAAPAFPSVIATAYLVLTTAPSVGGLFAALVAGAIAQLVVVGAVAWYPRPRSVDGARVELGLQAIQMIAVLVALSLIPPVQRVFAGTLDAAGVARFDYAARSIQAAQQLLIGGLLIALLPDWSRVAHDVAVFRTRVAATVTVAALVLSAAGSIALVAAPELTEFIFERGAFTPTDSEVVGLIVRLMSLGFMAEGITLLLAQAFYAGQRADLAIRIGFMRVGLQITLTVALGMIGGAPGVAAAYTVTMIVVAVVTVVAASGTVLAVGHRSLAVRAAAAALAIGGAGVIAMVAGDAIGALMGTALVLVVAIASASWLGPRNLMLMLREQRAPEA